MKAAIVVALLALAGCAVQPVKPADDPNVTAIQKSCDDKDQQQTVINGHAYFCDDFDHFNAQMNAIAKMLHQRGS